MTQKNDRQFNNNDYDEEDEEESLREAKSAQHLRISLALFYISLTVK